MSCVGYILTDRKTGERYVGITSRFPTRIYEHRQAGVMRGRDFNCDVVSEFLDITMARVWEIDAIANAGVESLLNISTGGHGGRGRPWTPEMRQEASARATARQADPTLRAKMSVRCKEVWSDPDRRAANSERTKTSCAKPEVKKRRSDAQKKTWEDPAVRSLRVATITAASRTSEGRKRRSETALARWAREKTA